MAETWVINETIDFGNIPFSANINFNAGTDNFVEFEYTERFEPILTNLIKYWLTSFEGDAIAVYANGWIDQAYRTVTFETSPTGALLTWLQANAVKQEPAIELDTTMWQLNSTPDLSADLDLSIENATGSWNTCEYYDDGDVKIAAWSFDQIQVSTNGYILWIGGGTPNFAYFYNSAVFDAVVAQFESLGFTIDQSDITSKSGYFYVEHISDTVGKFHNVRSDVIRFNSDDWDSDTDFTTWLSNSAEQIDEYAISDDVVEVGLNAFQECNSFETIEIHDSVTSIGDWAFSYCTGLTSIVIPDSVTSIGDWAFWGCTGLTSITIKAQTPPTIGSSVFQYTNDCPIYVPASSVNAYKTTWSDYADRIEAIQITQITLDLSTIGLPVGTHSIQIKLSDDGATKADSELSNAVSYVVAHTYTIATHISPVASITPSESNPTTIDENSTAVLHFGIDYQFINYYALPDSVTVTGATSTWVKGTGTLTLSNPTGNVSISLTAKRIYQIHWTYSGITPVGSLPFYLEQGTSTQVTFNPASGYNLPSSVTVSGATYNWSKSLTIGILTLSNPTGNVTAVLEGVPSLPQLDTPTNLTASGTTIEFDEVENAEKYEVFADGTSIGEFTPSSGFTISTFGGAASYMDGDCSLKVKFNSPPQSENDYDMVKQPEGAIQTTAEFPITVTKIYVWGNGNPSTTGAHWGVGFGYPSTYNCEESFYAYSHIGWSNAQEFVLTKDYDFILLSTEVED